MNEWQTELYQTNASFVPELGRDLIALLQPQPGERILDLGCGDGALTAVLAATGATVVGVDPSEDQIQAARKRNLDAHCISAEAIDYQSEFDGVLTNAVLHWIRDHARVVQNVYRALKPGGRFVGEFGGQGNVARICEGLDKAMENRGVAFRTDQLWNFAPMEDFEQVLESAGFQVQKLELFPRPTPLPTHMRGWLETFAFSLLGHLPESDRSGFLDEVCQDLAATLQRDDGSWWVDYVRLRFLALKP